MNLFDIDSYYLLQTDPGIISTSYNLWSSSGVLNYTSWTSFGRLVQLAMSLSVVIWLFINIIKAWFGKSSSMNPVRDVMIGIIVILLLRQLALSLT